jgi:hypothetical protein
MPIQSGKSVRVFQTAWFAKAAGKHQISERELYGAIRQVIHGQADDLGGGVFKKRLNKNRDRSIILAKGNAYWVYEYLFSKKDRANIEPEELRQFRRIAKEYAALTEQVIDELVMNAKWLEICNEDKDQEIQE